MVSSEQFIREYMAHYKEDNATKVIAGNLGIRPTSVNQRRVYLAKRGVKLPVARTAANRLEVSRLNELIKSLKKGN